jgi:hypothetical protein
MIATAVRKIFSDVGTRSRAAAGCRAQRRCRSPSAHPSRAARSGRPVDRGVEGGRHQHAAERRDRGQHGLTRRLQLALEQLALDLEPDQEEECRHPEVVDPQQQRLRENQPTVADANLAAQLDERAVERAERRVADDQRGNGGDREQHASGDFGLGEAAGVGDQGCGRRSINWSVTA